MCPASRNASDAIRVVALTIDCEDQGAATMTSAPAAQPHAEARQPEPVSATLTCCSDEEYAERIAKSDEVKGYMVPGYLAA